MWITTGKISSEVNNVAMFLFSTAILYRYNTLAILVQGLISYFEVTDGIAVQN